MSEALRAAKKAFITDMENDPSEFMSSEEIQAVLEPLSIEDQVEFMEFIAEYHETVLQPRLMAGLSQHVHGTKH